MSDSVRRAPSSRTPSPSCRSRRPHLRVEVSSSNPPPYLTWMRRLASAVPPVVALTQGKPNEALHELAPRSVSPIVVPAWNHCFYTVARSDQAPDFEVLTLPRETRRDDFAPCLTTTRTPLIPSPPNTTLPERTTEFPCR